MNQSPSAVPLITADQLSLCGDEALAEARAQIAALPVSSLVDTAAASMA